MSELKATPFVPGNARGVLRRGAKNAVAECIAMLVPAELGELAQRPAGILVVDAAPLSHAMIRLRTLGIPTVMIERDTADTLVEGREVFIDGFNGTLLESPPGDMEPAAAPAPPQAGQGIALDDGSRLLLCASVFSADDAAFAVKQGAAGIGLVRGECLLPKDGRPPDLAFYEAALRQLCAGARPLQLTIRLPDIGADKQVPWLNRPDGSAGPLGVQGVRLYEDQAVHDVVSALLTAVSGLADEYRISLLLPYVTGLDEFSYWRDRLEPHLGRSLPIGVMAESPAAVLAMPHWFSVADFVAIGCNDLMQCMFAADRDLSAVSRYLDPYAPELCRFLAQAAEAAGDNITKVQLCGLLSQIPGVLPVLLGMGYRTFSVSPVLIPYLADSLSGISMTQAVALATRVCQCRNSAEVRSLLDKP